MLTPREKSPLPENVPRGGSNPRRCGQRAQTLLTSYSGPLTSVFNRDDDHESLNPFRGRRGPALTKAAQLSPPLTVMAKGLGLN